ncbi:hypothetical protein M440DRAFT_1406779 [Trichoderma longibrachiatum ATCC 18648]|uniref:Smr domain-containing protein n=1 Tax=Trichoderma longibrachiatum ATCC 18648 TaxID=983965 RepID=A0A2T4BPP0_TRILO|nr:hypothetical protein M440DRAFT_1406779 [Trichoderma longibrachiatum ATCC 18648]
MNNTTGSSQLQQLLDLFRSSLDDSLVVAIAGDYDLSTEIGYEGARSTLDSLAQHAAIEEARSLDPEGVFRYAENGDQSMTDVTAPTSGLCKDLNGIQDGRSNQDGMATESSFNANGAAGGGLVGINSIKSDVEQLQALFPEIQRLDIRQALLGANGVVATALDTLLSVQYLRSTRQQPVSSNALLSIDEPGAKPVSKPGHNDGYGRQENEARASAGNANRARTSAAIAYIAERLHMSTEEVSLVYAENRNSKGATVVGILDQHLMQDLKPLTSEEKKAVGDLGQKYRNVPEDYLAVIVQITGPMSTHSSELASLVNSFFTKKSMNRRLDLGYRLTPLPHEDIEGEAGMAADKPAERRGISQQPTAAAKADVDLTRILQTSTSLQKQRQDAMASAASLYRRGSSNPLYRQAAGYYAQEAREHARRAQEVTSAAADLRVNQQSTDTTVDLHGVSVLDGVRIARQRTVDWWQALRQSREQQLPKQSLTIITGVGHHSTGGVSPLRQAVAAALKRDGWKFRVETGKFIITSRDK